MDTNKDAVTADMWTLMAEVRRIAWRAEDVERDGLRAEVHRLLDDLGVPSRFESFLQSGETVQGPTATLQRWVDRDASYHSLKWFAEALRTGSSDSVGGVLRLAVEMERTASVLRSVVAEVERTSAAGQRRERDGERRRQHRQLHSTA